MASGTALSKKRKRGAADDGEKNSRLSSQPDSQLGPVLVTYPSLEPDAKTPFQCYMRKRPRGTEEEEVVELNAQTTLIAGEAEKVEFATSSESQQVSQACKYYVAVHNKRTGQTTLRKAPLHLLSLQVKALKGIEAQPVTLADRMKARATLGESFGTKKAKAQILARERNKVDVDAMKGVVSYLQESVGQNTASLPSKEEAEANADAARLTPPRNASADNPAHVYPISNVIPETEMKAISIQPFSAAETHKDRVNLLPFTRSKWVNRHLESLCKEPPFDKKLLKCLFYISSLRAFRDAASRSKTIDKPSLEKSLSRIPSPILDGLLARFTETSRGSEEARMTPDKETLLLTSMFALMLRLDGWSVDTAAVGDDLGLPKPKINSYFKSLGCKIEVPKAADLHRLGLPSTSKDKRAFLKAPPVFPKPRSGKRRS